jgi:hypothetical protein
MQTTKRMKKIITFFLLCLAVNSYSQKYKLTYSGSVNTVYCDPDPFINGSALNSISLNSNVILRARCGNPESATNQVKEINYKPNTITSIVRYKGINSATSSIFTDIININLNHCDSWNGSENLLPNTYSDGNNFSFTIEPIINIVPPSIDPSCSVFISADNAGFETDIYNWEFQSLTDGWKPLPASFQGKPSFEINLTDLFGANAYQYFNKTINFRIRYCQTRFTNIVSFTFIPCSPLLEHNPPLVSNPSCNNTATGSIPLKFKSEIKDDEQLLLNLFIKTTDTDPQFLLSKFVPKSSIINNEYTWTNIGAGNYIIRYQAQKTTDNTTDVNSSAVTTEAFSIVDPPLFSFSATATQPKCNGEKGTITIAASGGTPPYYYYLNNDPKIEFTSPKTIDVDAGNNYIKVEDSKSCIDNTKKD